VTALVAEPDPGERRALLVSHRPLEHGGVGATRWGYLMRELPALGWHIETVSPRLNATTDDMSSDPRVARLSAMRARVMWRVGQLLRPAYRSLLHVQPEAFPPNFAWSFSGRAPIREAIARVGPHVVISTSPPPAALFASAVVAREAGVAFVADMRDPWAGHPFYDAGGELLTAIERRALSAASAIVAVTDPMLEELRARHPPLAARMQVLPNGFDPLILARRQAGRPDFRGRKATLIHPGTLFGERSVDVLVRALSRPELRERVRLELVGNLNTSSAAALRGRPGSLEVDARPPLAWADTIDRVARADIVVMIVPPTLGDQVAWAVKMFEALALGKPVLGLTGGGAGDRLLHELGVGQGCAHWDDAESVAAAVQRLLDDPPAPVAVERLARWDRSLVAREYAELLDRVATG
jgi:glycosyltransferase involved in cell wall biosynthesis